MSPLTTPIFYAVAALPFTMSNPSTESSDHYTPSVFWVAPARNFRSSARLHLQHLLWQNTTGFLLEPHVRASLGDPKELKVADLGCGNGVWLTDLASSLDDHHHHSLQLDGYDVNDVNFPHPDFLPAGVTLTKSDVLSEPPPDIVGTYDLVHVRAFSSIIFNNDPSFLLNAAMALLKPSGWLQWEEMDGGFVVHSPSGVPKTSCQAISHILRTGANARGLKVDFTQQLDRSVGAVGFGDVHLRRDVNRKQDYKAWTEDFLMVWEDVTALFPFKADKPEAPISKEMWTDIFESAVKETEQGVVLHQGSILTVVGQKPT